MENTAKRRKPTAGVCRACGKPSTKRGLCNAHYIRLQRNGTLDPVIEMFRERTSHPHYSKWRGTKETGRCPEWESFARFLADIGEQPAPTCRLRKKMVAEPWGPENFRWVAERTKEERAEIQRRGAARRYYGKVISGEPVWTPANRNNYLKRRFGISLADYDAMLAAQGGKCAICRRDDERTKLAVDHCHSTGVVRGLLCAPCNNGLGRFRDDPERLLKAAAYLTAGKRRAVA